MSKSTLEILQQRKAATGFLTANEQFVYTVLTRRATSQRTTDLTAMTPCEHGVWQRPNGRPCDQCPK